MRTAGLTGLEGKAGKDAASHLPHRVTTPLYPHFGKATMDAMYETALRMTWYVYQDRERSKFRPESRYSATRLSKDEGI